MWMVLPATVAYVVIYMESNSQRTKAARTFVLISFHSSWFIHAVYHIPITAVFPWRALLQHFPSLPFVRWRVMPGQDGYWLKLVLLSGINMEISLSMIVALRLDKRYCSAIAKEVRCVEAQLLGRAKMPCWPCLQFSACEKCYTKNRICYVLCWDWNFTLRLLDICVLILI